MLSHRMMALGNSVSMTLMALFLLGPESRLYQADHCRGGVTFDGGRVSLPLWQEGLLNSCQGCRKMLQNVTTTQFFPSCWKPET